jgi:holo-[acyl-carrier protein] synthase
VIYGIGTDIVRVERMRRSLDRFGLRFAARILNEAELADFARHPRPAHFLAKRFAAKEATAKAMGIGFRNGLRLRDIGVVNDANGKPLLELSGYAQTFTREQHITEMHVSLADEEDYAVAFVTLGRDVQR